MTEKKGIFSNSDDAILRNLGAQLKQIRLNKNLTQKELNEMSGLSRSAISDLENNGNGSMRSFVRILRTLEKLEILNHFITDVPISPVQVAKMRGKIRKRASGKRQGDMNKKEDSAW